MLTASVLREKRSTRSTVTLLYFTYVALSYFNFYLSPSDAQPGVSQAGMWPGPPPLGAFWEGRERSLRPCTVSYRCLAICFILRVFFKHCKADRGLLFSLLFVFFSPPFPLSLVLYGAEPADAAKHPQVEGPQRMLEGCCFRKTLGPATQGTLIPKSELWLCFFPPPPSNQGHILNV